MTTDASWAVTDGRPVGLLWASPDCKHFSKAKGGKPREKKIRGLALVGLRWVQKVRPRVIVLENVEEFQTWGPLQPDGTLKPEDAPEKYDASFIDNALRAAMKPAEQVALDTPKAPIHVGDALVELAEVRRRRHPADAQPCACLVDQVDRLVRQEPVADVAVGQRHGAHERIVLDAHPVVQLEALASLTGGRVFNATRTPLAQVFKEIRGYQ